MSGQTRFPNSGLASEQISRGEGLFGKLLTDKEQGEQIVDDLTMASASLRRLAERLDSGRGMMGRLFSDEEYAEKVLADIQTTTKSVAEITSRISEGEGTIGKLMHDESIYDGLNDIVAGVNKSRLTKWVLRRNQNSGYKSRMKTVKEIDQDQATEPAP